MLDSEPYPAPEPDDVDVDEGHRAGEYGDLVRDPVLGALGAHSGVFRQRRVRQQTQPVAMSRWPSTRDGRAGGSGTPVSAIRLRSVRRIGRSVMDTHILHPSAKSWPGVRPIDEAHRPPSVGRTLPHCSDDRPAGRAFRAVTRPASHAGADPSAVRQVGRLPRRDRGIAVSAPSQPDLGLLLLAFARASRLALRGSRHPLRGGELVLSVGARPDRAGLEGVVSDRVRPIGRQCAWPDRPRLGDAVHGGHAAEGRGGRWAGSRRAHGLDRTADRHGPGAPGARAAGDHRRRAHRPRARDRCLPGRGRGRVAHRGGRRPVQDRRSARMDRSRHPTSAQRHAEAPTPRDRTLG